MENRNILNSHLYIDIATVAKKAKIPVPSSLTEKDLTENPFVKQTIARMCAERSAYHLQKLDENFQALMGQEWEKIASFQINQLQQKQDPFKNFELLPVTSGKGETKDTNKVDASNNPFLKELLIENIQTHSKITEINTQIQEKYKEIEQVSSEIVALQVGVTQEIQQHFKNYVASLEKDNKKTDLALLEDQNAVLEEVNAIRNTLNPIEQIKHFGRLFQVGKSKNDDAPATGSALSADLTRVTLGSILFFHQEMQARDNLISTLTNTILSLDREVTQQSNKLGQDVGTYIKEIKEANSSSIKPSLNRQASVSEPEVEPAISISPSAGVSA